jgi:hypothetical protein
MKYLPPVSDLIDGSLLPDFLSGIRGGLNNLLANLKLKEYQVERHPYFGGGSWYLVLRTTQRVDLDLFGTGLMLVFNPSFDASNPGSATDIPLSLSVHVPISDYIRDFQIQQFAGSPEALFELICKVVDADEESLTEAAIRNVVPSGLGVDLVAAINANYTLAPPLAPVLTGDPRQDAAAIVEAVEAQPTLAAGEKDMVDVLLDTYILTPNPPIPRLDFLEKVFAFYFSGRVVDSVTRLFIPQIDAAIGISAGLEFPRSYLVPVKPNGEVETDENIKTVLVFSAGEFRYSTAGLIGFNEPLTISFPPSYPKAQIGNTGLTLGFLNAKLDLSRDKNIPEAISDGRPDDFIGVFIEEATIGFPAFWKKDEGASTAEITGKRLLIGTGGISGTIGLDVTNGSILKADLGAFSISLDSFDLTFKQNSLTHSNIHGTLVIPGFQDSTGNDAKIDIGVHIGGDGDFEVTAGVTAGVTIGFKDIFTFDITEARIGRKGTRFYFAVAGTLEFASQLGKFLPDKVEIEKLLIWDDGKFEFEGGKITLPRAISLSIGPVHLSVSALGLGSHEQDHQGHLRQYKYFTFDGGLNVNPGGVDVSASGVAFYYTVDNDETGLPAHRFLRIQSIAVDLAIPGGASRDEAVLLLKGYLSMRAAQAPSSGTEYAGSIVFTLPRLKMSGGASMRLNPSVPAFIIDVGLEIASPILLGSTGLGIWGFRALAGLRFIATKHAANVDDTEPWWKYYKAKIADDFREGIQVSKFEQTRGFSLGAGVSLATASDTGLAFSSKIFFLLSVPEVFLLQGQGQILKGRILLTDTTDPPFFALIAITRSSIETAFGVKYGIPAEGDKPGGIATVDGVIEMGFSWGNSTAWYINIGREDPASQRIAVRLLSIIDAYFYFMMSNSGIRAGAGAGYHLSKKFGPLKAELHAYLDTAGRISFRPSQIGASIRIGGSVDLSIFGFGFGFSAAASLAAEGTKPFTVVGTLEVCVRVLRKDRCARFEFSWIFNQNLDTSEIKLLKDNARDSVKALNIHTHETYELWTGGALPAPGDVDAFMIPMDSYIDLELIKGVKPSATVLSAFGGNTMGSSFVEYLAPQRGKNDRVRHEYTLDAVDILYYDGGWKPYDVHGAATPAPLASFVTSDPATLRQGFWQYQQPNLHNKLRILAQTPLTYVSQGSGDFVPEDSGITTESIFCAPTPIAETCTAFDHFQPDAGTLPAKRLFFHGHIQFRVTGADGSVVDEILDTATRAVKLESGSTLEIFPIEPAVSIRLKLRTTTDTAVARFYCRVPVPPASPGLPVTRYAYALVGTKPIPRREGTATVEVRYDDIEQPVDKIVLEAGVCRTDPRLLCGAEVTQTGRELERFLDTLVQRGGLAEESTDLLIRCEQTWEGIFLHTSLYAAPIEEMFIRWEVLSFSGTELHGEITDWRGFRCPIDLTLVDGGPVVDWASLIRLFNIRPDLTAPVPGFNRKFFIDGEVRTARGTRKVTLHGTSCYEVAFCSDASPFERGPVTNEVIALGELLTTLAAGNRLAQPRIQLAPSEIDLFDRTFLTADNVIVPIVRKVRVTTAFKPEEQRLDVVFDEAPNRGEVSLTLPNLQPGFTFDAVTALSNVRPDLTLLHEGPNSDLLIDARVRGPGGESSVTLRGVTSINVTTATLPDPDQPLPFPRPFPLPIPLPFPDTPPSLDELPGDGEITRPPGGRVAFPFPPFPRPRPLPHDCALFLYEVCVLDYAAASFNETLPTQSSVDAEVASIVNAFQGNIQILWRPNTRYAIRVTTSDRLYREGGQSGLATYPRTEVFGFSTVGPLGHFHIYQDGSGNPVPRSDYAALEASGRADEFKLAGLLHYVDFDKSYPNADGQLLNAKPLFYAEPKLLLFYLQTYVARMFCDWAGVGGLEGANAVFEVVVKDPAPDPGAAATGAVEATWLVSPLPIVSQDVTILNNMIKHGQPCANITEIEPTWLYSEFPLEAVNLQPLKLYTAVFNLRFKKQSETTYVTRELLHYAFQTSRYATLAEQVDSWKLKVATDGTVLERAVFDVGKAFTAAELAVATSVLDGSMTAGDPLRQNFAEPLNRLLEGALHLEAIHPPRGTEFNVLRDTASQRILGVLVKSPEPFNDPKLPPGEIEQSVRLSVNGGDPALYKAIHSKDLSQVFLTNQDNSMNLPPGATLDFTFDYKQWNGAQYQTDDTAHASVVLP